MTNRAKEDIESKLEESTADEPSGKLDGLDQAMSTEAVERDTGAETYTVQPGDNLRSIAQRFYGDPTAYTRIIEANPEDLRDSEIVRPGLQLTIPR